MNAPQIQLTGGAIAVVVGLGVAGVLLYKASKAADNIGQSLSAGFDTLAAIPGQVLDTVQEGAAAVSVDYAQDLPPSQHPYGITLTPEEQAIKDNYRPFGGFFDGMWGSTSEPVAQGPQYGVTGTW